MNWFTTLPTHWLHDFIASSDWFRHILIGICVLSLAFCLTAVSKEVLL